MNICGAQHGALKRWEQHSGITQHFFKFISIVPTSYQLPRIDWQDGRVPISLIPLLEFRFGSQKGNTASLIHLMPSCDGDAHIHVVYPKYRADAHIHTQRSPRAPHPRIGRHVTSQSTSHLCARFARARSTVQARATRRYKHEPGRKRSAPAASPLTRRSRADLARATAHLQAAWSPSAAQAG